MSVNNRELGANKGVGTYSGVANPTIHNGVSDPLRLFFRLILVTYTALQVTNPTTENTGADAGPRFEGHQQAQRDFKGVVEGKPGIIESANIGPLNENSNKEDGWANATRTPGTSSSVTGAASGGVAGAGTAADYASQAASVATGAAKFAYGHATGNEKVKCQGSEAVWGSEQWV